MKRLIAQVVVPLALSAVAMAVPMTVVPWDGEVAERKLAIAYGEKTLPLDYLHPSVRSKPLSVPAESDTLRVIDLQNPGTKDKPIFVPIKLPEGVKKPLLLLIPNEKSEIGLRTFVIEDSAAKFPYGSFTFLNATGRKLMFWCEKKIHPVTDQFEPSVYKPGGQSRPLQIEIYLPEMPDKLFYADVWEHKDTLRQLVIIVPKDKADKSGVMDFKFIVEDERDVKQTSN